MREAREATGELVVLMGAVETLALVTLMGLPVEELKLVPVRLPVVVGEEIMENLVEVGVLMARWLSKPH